MEVTELCQIKEQIGNQLITMSVNREPSTSADEINKISLKNKKPY